MSTGNQEPNPIIDSLLQAFGLGSGSAGATTPTGPGAAQPITGQELLLRALGAIANPQRAINVPDTTLGRLSGLLSRGAGGIASAKAEDLQRLRLDPVGRKLAIGQSALEGLQGLTVPSDPVRERVLGGLEQQAPELVQGLKAQVPLTQRAPQTIREVNRVASPELQQKIFQARSLGLPIFEATGIRKAPTAQQEAQTALARGRLKKLGEPEKSPSIGTILEGIAQSTIDKRTGRAFKRFSDVPGPLRPGMRQQAKDEKLALKRAEGVGVAQFAERIRQKTLAREKAEQEIKAQEPGSGARYVDPDTFEVADPQATKEQAVREGKVEATPKQLKNLAELDGLKGAFRELKIAVTGLKRANRLLRSEAVGKIPGSQLASVSAELGATYKTAAIKFSSFYDKQLGGLRGGASVPLLDITKEFVVPNQFNDTDRVIDFKMKSLDIIVNAFTDRARRSITGRRQSLSIDNQLKELGELLSTFTISGNKPSPPILEGQGMSLEEFERQELLRQQQGLQPGQ